MTGARGQTRRAEDELTRRRKHLVDRLEARTRAALKPEYQGYYGQLIQVGRDSPATRPGTKLVGDLIFRPALVDW